MRPVFDGISPESVIRSIRSLAGFTLFGSYLSSEPSGNTKESEATTLNVPQKIRATEGWNDAIGGQYL